MMKKRRLLVVDDDLSVRESLGRLLRSEHHDVELASDGRQAMECLESKHIDLVLLDVNLGVEDGWRLFERISEFDESIPVVIVTGEHEQEDAALAARVDGLVEKPIDIDGFLEVVNRLLAETAEERTRRRSEDECLRYVPRWGERYFAAMSDRYAKPMRLACLAGTWRPRHENRKEEKDRERGVRN